MTPTSYIPQPIFDNAHYLKGATLNLSIPGAVELDFVHAKSFLMAYSGSDATFNAYRREIERLYHWCWHYKQRSIRELKRDEFEEFIQFCQNPPASWIGVKQVTRFVDKAGERLPNPAWRPYVVNIAKKAHQAGISPAIENYRFSQTALQALFSIASTFFNYLLQEGYVEFNPIMMIRQKNQYLRKHQGTKVVRRLSELQWSYIIETAEQLAQSMPAAHERTLFVMNALFALYLRISELASSLRWEPQMQHFFKDRDGHWWFKTVGKGNKERDIAVSDSMLKALKRYRAHLGLPALPYSGDSTPLLLNLQGKGSIKGTRHIRKIVQFCFDKAIERLEADQFLEEADELRSATVHWLRHTGISEDVKRRPREHVRDDAGHSSGAITDRYIDIELRARHASAKNKAIKPF